MMRYWKDYRGDDENLWAHEWAKHGTCINTLKTSCYEDYFPQREVVDYFRRTTSLFRTLDTYQILAEAGIQPNTQRKWAAAELAAPLARAHGADVTLGCRGDALGEVWYHFDVQGSVRDGEFVPSQPDGMKSSCAETGIRYLPKQPSATTTGSSSTSTGVIPTASPHPFSGSGYLMVLFNGSQQGCLISHGEWYTSGTCAAYYAQTDVVKGMNVAHSFTLTSSKGPCSFLNGIFRCGSDNATQAIFSNDDSKLMFKESSAFWGMGVPHKGVKGNIFAEKTPGTIALSIHWVAK